MYLLSKSHYGDKNYEATKATNQGWQSHRKSHRIPRFFRKNIASDYRIKTTKKIASVIASQNLTKKICDFFDYFDFLSLILL